LALVVLPGCRGIKRIPVSGSVSLDGKPLSVGVVNFFPDTEKGNDHRIAALGPAKSGSYTLATTAVRNYDNGMGVPVGWYKVCLLTDIPGAEDLKIHPRFKDPNKTPISIEVVENPGPGAYDIKFTSK
jgi:hypothetical protein